MLERSKVEVTGATRHVLHTRKAGQISRVPDTDAVTSLLVHLSSKSRARKRKSAKGVSLPAATELSYRLEANWYVFRRLTVEGEKRKRECVPRAGSTFAERATADRKLVPMRTHRQLT